MADIYNLTEVEAATTIPDFVTAMNTLSNGWVGGALIILATFIALVTFKLFGIDSYSAMLGSSSLAFFISGLALYFDFINWIIFTLSIAYFAVSMVLYWVTG